MNFAAIAGGVCEFILQNPAPSCIFGGSLDCHDTSGDNNVPPLTIFHVDMNFVCYRQDYLRSLLARIAKMGYNAVLWELEDKVQLDTCPDACWSEAMSKKQFASILNYSQELGLEPIPLLQTVGHGEYIMKHPSYAHLREQPDRIDCYCTSSQQAKDFLRTLTAEYMDLFGKVRYFHFGGDEAYVFATCPKCRSAAQSIGPNKLYANHIKEVAAPAIAAGARPGIWCDMVMHHPDQVEAIDKNFVIWDWNYWDNDQSPKQARIWGEGWRDLEKIDSALLKKIPELLDENGRIRSFYAVDMLKRLGYEVVLCSSSRCGLESLFCPRHGLHVGNIAGAAKKAANTGILGHCVTSWAVRINSLDLQELLLALEPAARNNPDTSADEAAAIAGKDLFGVDPSDFIKAADMISQYFVFGVSGSQVGSGIQWNRLKDSTLPPKDYAFKCMRFWRETDDENLSYPHLKQQLLDARGPITEGIELMKQFSLKVTTQRGREVVAQWLLAGDMQLKMNDLGQELFAIFENRATRGADEMISLSKSLRRQFTDWALTWMTPECAQHNASLIFDHLIEAFEEGCLQSA
ncbi:MAG: family 20 glycosylhydrolase [Planctomycetes bacterium]|nr:family 20 glycosylhydrolase [Planctomycetota bacterium]